MLGVLADVGGISAIVLGASVGVGVLLASVVVLALEVALGFKLMGTIKVDIMDFVPAPRVKQDTPARREAAGSPKMRKSRRQCLSGSFAGPAPVPAASPAHRILWFGILSLFNLALLSPEQSLPAVFLREYRAPREDNASFPAYFA